MEWENLEGEWQNPPAGGGLPVSDEEFISNIRSNCKLELPNLNKVTTHDKTMIMVCGGTTAQLYLDEIKEKRKDDKYRIFCSNNTGDWLIENGIIPDAHFIIDPKKQKIEDIKNPQPSVQYMFAVCCNPGLFEKLKDYKVTRIMTYCNIQVAGVTDIQIIKALFHENDYTPLDGGTMAGLRAMTLADILGYKTVEFYGLDSCFYEYDEQHRPICYSFYKPIYKGKVRDENVLDTQTTDGRTFLSTPVLASQARQFIKWKHRLAWMDFIIHGDSLTAHIHKLDDEAQKPKHNKLITDYMIQMNSELHSRDQNYGESVGQSESVGKLSLLAGQIAKKYEGATLLDYGCGKGFLFGLMPQIVGLKMCGYDPCVNTYSQRPEPADIVSCIDVLEHVEPDCLENVLNDLQALTKKVCFLQVSVLPASKSYSDGQNTHLIIQPWDWWYPKLKKRFNINEAAADKKHFVCVLQAKEIR